MNLGNDGWGLTTMIIFLVMFFLFILIVAIISYNLGLANTEGLMSFNNYVVNLY